VKLIQSHINELTNREMQTFTLLAKGLSIKSVALELNIQPKTVHAHKSNLFSKLEIKNQVELLQLALSQNILCLDDLK